MVAVSWGSFLTLLPPGGVSLYAYAPSVARLRKSSGILSGSEQ